MKKQSDKSKKFLLNLLFFICINILIYNIAILVNWKIDQSHILNETKEIEDIVETTILDNEEAEQVNPPTEEISDYWYYINFPLQETDIRKLKNINPDTVGFLSVAGTNINYPIVKTINNDYYLTHSFKKKNNNAGWVFMDYRNSSDFTDRNTVIYGHSRIDRTMFGTLKNILSSSWISDKNNYIIRYSSDTENMLFQVFSVYVIPAESYYIQTEFVSSSEYQKWLDTMIKRSNHDFNTKIDENDKILTLSTCKDGNRVVIHSKLIKKSQKNNL